MSKIEDSKEEAIQSAFGAQVDTLKETVSTCVFRDYLLASDLNMILNNWMTRNRRHYEFLPDRVYYVGMQKLIGALATEGNVVIAHNPEDINDVLGWIVYAPTEGTDAVLVHYTYVKHRFRRYGLGKRLLQAIGFKDETALVSSHKWDAPKATKKKYNYFYNPCFTWKGH